MTDDTKYDAFLSYNSENIPAVEFIAARLIEEAKLQAELRRIQSTRGNGKAAKDNLKKKRSK